MLPKRFSVKLVVENPEAVEIEAFVPVFQRWIQKGAVEGLLIDVADYKHLHHGPGIILVGHEADYSLDFAEGRPGLKYKIKRHDYESFDETLADSLRRVVIAAHKLEQEPSLQGIRFKLDEVEIRYIDKLKYTNDLTSFRTVEQVVGAAAQKISNDTEIEYVLTDPRQPLTIRLLFGTALDILEHIAI